MNLFKINIGISDAKHSYEFKEEYYISCTNIKEAIDFCLNYFIEYKVHPEVADKVEIYSAVKVTEELIIKADWDKLSD